ncbi:MAG: glutamate--tRNA ligase [Cyclobacteriaceae bacterium]|nr:glutamate--tRNA ligase [Cyclobacteriaceae bacterium]
MSEIRVRFAPSPTGPLHIGGVRTALYNYLFAKKNGGKFIVRIEDTDQARYVKGAEEYILESLRWLGLSPDEGPEQGGPYLPYRQSERKGLYEKYAMQLVSEGKAYYAFDTPEEIEEMRVRLEDSGVVKPQYNSITRHKMKNSLTLSEEETNALIAQNAPYVIRLKVPSKEEIRFEDQIRGWVVVHSSTIDDKVLLKSDGMPTYHMANVVDDHIMQITHVIRGEEWLPSAPLHILLYKFLGWESEMPTFAHLPLILKPTGKGKLSKRDSDKHGFPIFPLAWDDPESEDKMMGFREEDYLPEALLNFLAFLGWNPGTEKELFTLDELIEAFGLERITKGGARFDIEKANWYNEQYLRKKPDNFLVERLLSASEKEGFECSKGKGENIVRLMKDRVSFPKDLLYQARYFFEAPEEYDEKLVKKKWDHTAIGVFMDYAKQLKKLDEISAAEAKSTLEKVLVVHEAGLGQVMLALRLAITGGGTGPDVVEIISVLGGQETAQRIEKAIEVLPVKGG